MTTAVWRKSSRSGGNGGDCVEVATAAGTTGHAEVAVRDSKDPHGPKLAFTPTQWREFTAAIKAGEFGSG